MKKKVNIRKTAVILRIENFILVYPEVPKHHIRNEAPHYPPKIHHITRTEKHKYSLKEINRI